MRLTNLREVIELLYTINSKIISLNWIALKQKPTKGETDFINKSLGECIKILRKIEVENQSQEHKGVGE
jgi:hypothetical protein